VPLYQIGMSGLQGFVRKSIGQGCVEFLSCFLGGDLVDDDWCYWWDVDLN